MGPFDSIEAIEAANEAIGHHFFEPAAKRFFRSHIGQIVYGGRFFVTSEQFEGSGGKRAPRRYTVRMARDSGEIVTVGEFQQYSTAAGARARCIELVHEEEERAALAHAAEEMSA